jgi:NAD(P)-dependent dehydrogenase (short-subunit alcohol dehydrogenase family)
VQSPAPFIYLPEVPTEGYRNLGNEEQMAQFAAQMAAQIPLGRVGQPDEIVKAVVFLASDDNGISFSKRSRRDSLNWLEGRLEGQVGTR